MSGFLLDTNVISMLSPAHVETSARFLEWLGNNPGMADATIAGTAKARDLVIVSNNTKHFAPFGIDTATPDEAVRLD